MEMIMAYGAWEEWNKMVGMESSVRWVLFGFYWASRSQGRLGFCAPLWLLNVYLVRSSPSFLADWAQVHGRTFERFSIGDGGIVFKLLKFFKKLSKAFFFFFLYYINCHEISNFMKIPH